MIMRDAYGLKAPRKSLTRTKVLVKITNFNEKCWEESLGNINCFKKTDNVIVW